MSKIKVQLRESHDFMKKFIRFSVNSKKVFLKNLIINQLNEDKEQQRPEINSAESQSIVNDGKEQLLNGPLNSQSQDESFHKRDFHSKDLIIDPQFIIECIFLAILDLDGKLLKFS
jgi:hypothetical protein